MRVISPFHDYYDSAQSFGQDMSVVFNRKTVVYEEDKTPDNVSQILSEISKEIRRDWAWRWALPHILRVDGKQYDLSYGQIIFCGVMYPFIRFYSFGGKEEFIYSYEAFLSKFGDADFTRSYKDAKRVIKDYFSKNGTDALKNLLVEHKAITMSWYNRIVTINPVLSEYQFYKAKPAWEAYQELDSYICGVLTFPQNAMVEIEDKYRIEQHGFDKWSFRKMPTKNK